MGPKIRNVLLNNRAKNAFRLIALFASGAAEFSIRGRDGFTLSSPFRV